MKRNFMIAATAAFATIAMASAPLASAGTEEDFLQVISDNGITWPSGKDQAVVDTGQAVCTDWASGATFASEVSDLQSATDWSDYQIGVFIGASTAAFCPEYDYKLPN